MEPKKGSKRRSIRDGDKKGRTKTVPRCTSPSHFLMDDAAAAASAGSSSSSLPFPSSSASRHADKLRTDALLSSVSALYYRHRSLHPSSPQDVLVSAEYDRSEYTTLDTLCSPLRQPSPLDSWSPLDVALFESGICCHGKDFHAVSRLMGGRRSVSECVEFYYLWKKSGHYAMWKEAGKPVRRRTEGKAEQWKIVEERMQGWKGGAAAAAGQLAAAAAVKAEESKQDGSGMQEEKAESAAGLGKRKREDEAADRNGSANVADTRAKEEKQEQQQSASAERTKQEDVNGSTKPETAAAAQPDTAMSLS